MKKILLSIALLGTMAFGGCTSADVSRNFDTAMNKVNRGLDYAMDTLSSFRKDKPALARLSKPSSKAFNFKEYKMFFNYPPQNNYVEYTLNGIFINNTSSPMTLETIVPVYNATGGIYETKILRNYIPGNTSKVLNGKSMYSTIWNKDGGIIPSRIVTKVYQNGRLIASAGEVSSPKKRVQKTTQKATQQTRQQARQTLGEAKAAVPTAPAVPTQRQKRQNIAK